MTVKSEEQLIMEPQLELRLWNTNELVDQESSQKLTWLESLDKRPLNILESGSKEKRERVEQRQEKKDFSCKHCNKKFLNSQALGGHQNAHKRERALARKEKGMMDSYHPYSHFHHPYSPVSRVPYDHTKKEKGIMDSYHPYSHFHHPYYSPMPRVPYDNVGVNMGAMTHAGYLYNEEGWYPNFLSSQSEMPQFDHFSYWNYNGGLPLSQQGTTPFPVNSRASLPLKNFQGLQTANLQNFYQSKSEERVMI